MTSTPYQSQESTPMSVAEPAAAYSTAARQRVYYKPDADFYRGITAEELLVGIHEDIHKMFAQKKCG